MYKSALWALLSLDVNAYCQYRKLESELPGTQFDSNKMQSVSVIRWHSARSSGVPGSPARDAGLIEDEVSTFEARYGRPNNPKHMIKATTAVTTGRARDFVSCAGMA